jgi:ribosomal protein S27AE
MNYAEAPAGIDIGGLNQHDLGLIRQHGFWPWFRGMARLQAGEPPKKVKTARRREICTRCGEAFYTARKKRLFCSETCVVAFERGI